MRDREFWVLLRYIRVINERSSECFFGGTNGRKIQLTKQKILGIRCRSQNSWGLANERRLAQDPRIFGHFIVLCLKKDNISFSSTLGNIKKTWLGTLPRNVPQNQFCLGKTCFDVKKPVKTLSLFEPSESLQCMRIMRKYPFLLSSHALLHTKGTGGQFVCPTHNALPHKKWYFFKTEAYFPFWPFAQE